MPFKEKKLIRFSVKCIAGARYQEMGSLLLLLFILLLFIFFPKKESCESLAVSMHSDRDAYRNPLQDFKNTLFYLIASFETYILLRFGIPFSCIKLQVQINFSCVSSDLWKMYQIHLELSTLCLNYTLMCFII